MKAVAVELGLPENYFADKCSPPMTVFAFWHYPPYPADTDSWGVGPHTDYGMWTFLLQDDTGGLEVEITEGQWVEVKPMPGIVSKLIMPVNPVNIFLSKNPTRLLSVQFPDKKDSCKSRKRSRLKSLRDFYAA